MSSSDKEPVRPPRVVLSPLPPIPDVSKEDADSASVDYSHYRTNLSRHRTGLSEHRTDLSEYRTDLSRHRTDMSEHRTDLSEHRTKLSGDRTEMSMRRTGMSIQRTRMSADRTLMSVIRTALSMIGFGFTLFQVFQKLHESGVIHQAAAPRNFGLSLIVLGVFLLLGGIVNHLRFALELRRRRGAMKESGLIHAESAYPTSITFLTAVALLIVGVVAAVSIILDLSLFG